jgi:hypothetical protein
MQRSGFRSKRPFIERESDWAADLFAAKRLESPRLTVVVRLPAAKMPPSPIVSRPKENAVYSEPYRRLVAALPCAICGIELRSQAAHPPPSGKSRKEDDRKIFPLCADDLERPGCHTLFDQYKLYTYEETCAMAVILAIHTRYEIMTSGKWPKGLLYWMEAE